MKKNLHVFIPSKLHTNGGGIETWLEYFLRHLPEANYYKKIYIYGFNHKDDRDKIYNLKFKDNVKFFLAPTSKVGNGVLNIIKFVRFHNRIFKSKVLHQDHVLVLGSVYLSPLIYLIKRGSLTKNLKLIVWIRSKTIGELKARGSRFVNMAPMLEKIAIKYSDIVITNGDDTFNFYSKQYQKYKKKISKLYNAVDHRRFSMIDIEKWDKRSLKNIAYMGRYVEAKGFKDYVNAIYKVYTQETPPESIKFYAYGHGELERITESVELNNMGPYKPNDLIRILSNIDIVVLLNKSNKSGGLSHSLLEVMAAGKLIIAWKNDVHCQVLDDGNSILVDEGNIGELIRTFINVDQNYANYGQYYNMRVNARSKAENFSIENHIKGFINLVR